MNGSANREVAIFTEALRLQEGEREAYLQSACGGDEDLKQRVEALLNAHFEAGTFLESVPLLEGSAAQPVDSIQEKPGERIGRYKLLQQIGEGGCGVVYMAEQEKPIRRRVALKVIKAGMDTKSVIARFEAERQALALMDHPNIAKVLDAGATDSGRPYFVMELVRGVKITTYCDEHALTTEQRLILFVQVCHAVQHAHQKGIIHRDLKPSNILVTQTLEGTALPVVIDFGIAKATTNQPLTDKTLFTAFEMLIGTPAYMSPEQAALTSADVDTRTDIYSLGVLLYELLTGSTPFDAGELLKAGLDEIRRVIREDEPVRPSTRLSKLTNLDLTAVAHRRHAEPPVLIRTVRGDLDWIVMKALEKSRSRRYETANGLALDIQRHLANETVAARPPSAAYRFQKAVLRNKLLFAAIGVVATLLVVSLILISTSLAKERQARQEADAALRQAETEKATAQVEAAKSRQVTKFLEDMLTGVGPSVALGRDTKMLREILDKAAVRVGTELAEQPAIQAELQNRIGSVFFELTVFDQAKALHRAALTTNRRLFGEVNKAVADSLSDLARVLFRQHNLVEAETMYRETLDVRRKLFGPEHPDVATSMKDLAGVFYFQVKYAEGEKLNREALAMRRKLLGNENLAVADSLNALGMFLSAQDKTAEVEATHREVLALRRKLLGPEHPQTVSSFYNLGIALAEERKLAESETCLREAVALSRKLYGEVHLDYARALLALGDTLRLEEKWEEAEMLAREGHAIAGKLYGNELNLQNGGSLASLGGVLEARGKLAEAESIRRQLFELARKTRTETQQTAVLDPLIAVLAGAKKFAEAEQLLADFSKPDFLRKPESADFLITRGNYLARRGRWPEAAADFSLSLEHGSTDFACHDLLIPLLIETHEPAKYQLHCRKMMERFGGSTTAVVVDQLALDCLILPSSGADLKSIEQMLASAEHAGLEEKSARWFRCSKALLDYRLARYAQAIEWAQKALEGGRPDGQGMAYAILSMSHHRLGQEQEARAALAAATELALHQLPLRGSEDLGAEWRRWIFVQALMSEAKSMLEAGPASEVDPKKASDR